MKAFLIIPAFVALLALSIPWYWPSDTLMMVMGFPLWGLVSLFFAFLASVLALGPLLFVEGGKVWGFHPGVYGLLVNLAIALGGSLLMRGRPH